MSYDAQKILQQMMDEYVDNEDSYDSDDEKTALPAGYMKVDDEELYRYWKTKYPSNFNLVSKEFKTRNDQKNHNYINPEDLQKMHVIKRDYIFDRLGISNKPDRTNPKVNGKEVEKTGLDKYVQEIFDREFNREDGVKNTSTQIDPQIYFNYNSFNLCIGNQGTAKTATVMGEFIKLSQVEHDYHMIIFVSDTPDDHTRSVLSEYINIPMMKIPYAEAEEKFEEVVRLKEQYNAMVDGAKDKDPRILSPLRVDDFSKKRLHTILFFDDAAGIFDKNSKSKFRKWFCEIRHTNTTVFCNVQSWGHISAELKSQLTNVFLFGGFSRERLQYIWKQIPNALDFDAFFYKYSMLKPFQKMIINTKTQEIIII